MGNARSCNNQLFIREMPQQVRALHIAVTSNDRDAVRSLVAQGVNINFPFLHKPATDSFIPTRDGNTPLIIAVSLNYTEIVEVLLRAGACINRCDKNGCTPVYKAAFHGRPSLIELLAKAGADVNLPDFQGKTPLYICVNNAIVHSCRPAIIKLLSAGALVDKCDRLGQAPIHVAAQWKLVDILAILIASKSNVNTIDQRGRTPLYVCVSMLSTKLYAEDLRHQLPCIITLFRAGADMLNLVEWLLVKGPGISDDLWPPGADDFRAWYETQLRRPAPLAGLCRKAIQLRISSRTVNSSNLVQTASTLPLPPTVRKFVCRKMFYREKCENYIDCNQCPS